MGKRDDIKAPDGYLLGGIRKVRADGTILFARGYWQAPKEWAGKEVWVHNNESSGNFDTIDAAPPGEHIYRARLDLTAVICKRTEKPDAKPVFRNASTKAWINRS